MAATKYQILYRYTNPNSNQFITNDSGADYVPVFEFYHDKHKIAIGTADEILAANNEKSNLIINGNNTAIDNYSMLFKFTGTKRKNKKVWVPKSIGYVIRDKQAIKDLTSRAVDGDYSGNYLLMEGSTIENGVVVAKKNPLTSTITVVSDSTLADKGDYYTESYLYNLITMSTIGKLNTTSCADHGSASATTKQQTGVNANRDPIYRDVYVGPVAVDVQRIDVKNSYSTVYGSLTSEGLYKDMTVKATQIQTYDIPAHYEDVAEYPYVVCDTYEKIEQSPWFILSTHASLPSALEKAKMIVQSVGIENVKMIKVVPTEQFVKIR